MSHPTRNLSSLIKKKSQEEETSEWEFQMIYNFKIHRFFDIKGDEFYHFYS